MSLHLFTDDYPETTLKGLGFSNLKKTKSSIAKIESYFSKREEQQKIPGIPKKLRPVKKLTTKAESSRYFQNQKMYRVLGLLNRAKVMVKRIKEKENIEKSILLLEDWVTINKISK